MALEMHNNGDNSKVPQTSNNTEKRSFWEWFRTQFNPRPPDDDEPQNWWFASTAIPLIAATTSPLANVMSIVGLVMSWKNNIIPDKNDPFSDPQQVGIGDPRWCIALNATSLACGILGNVFLLFNFTRTIRYIIALPASIILWTFSTTFLIGATAGIHVYASPISPSQTYSQGYWSAVIAAALYFILSIILMINMLGYVLGHYPQYFALTDGQRTLILQTLSFVIWLIIGAVIFHTVMDINFADALYFSDITVLTLGFGDITPTTAVGRGLVLPYAVMGVIILGLVISSIHQFARELHYTNVVQKHIERKRRATVKRSITIENDQITGRANGASPLDSAGTSRIAYRTNRSQKEPIRSKIDPLSRGSRPKLLVMKEEKDRFDAMRAIQNETVIFRRTYSLTMSIIIFGIVWSCGAVVFWQLEGNLTYFEALYFGFCSLLTIGYGDITPTTNAARPFFIVWSLIAIPTMTILISEMSDTIITWFKHATDIAADWTVLPHAGKYRAFIERFPVISAALKRREENKRVAQGFRVGLTDEERGVTRDDNSSRRPIMSLEELARHPTPSRQELAKQLAFAIRRTAENALASKPKRYSYEEWVEFSRMIRFTDPSPDDVVLEEDEYGVLNWDWIGETSPMLASQTEPAWVLDRLCESLIRYVDSQDSSRGNEKTPKDENEGRDGDGDGNEDEDEPTLKKERAILFEDE